MEKFKLKIIETLERVVKVEAEDKDEAFAKLKEMYLEEEIVLDADDFADYEIYQIEDDKE